jgi:hypothetical protein
MRFRRFRGTPRQVQRTPGSSLRERIDGKRRVTYLAPKTVIADRLKAGARRLDGVIELGRALALGESMVNRLQRAMEAPTRPALLRPSRLLELGHRFCDLRELVRRSVVRHGDGSCLSFRRSSDD